MKEVSGSIWDYRSTLAGKKETFLLPWLTVYDKDPIAGRLDSCRGWEDDPLEVSLDDYADLFNVMF